MKPASLRSFLALVTVWVSGAVLPAAPFRAELNRLPDGLSAELSHPGRPGARYVIEEASDPAGPWTVALSYYGTSSNLLGGVGRLTVPLPPPPPPGPPQPVPPPAEAQYEFWIWRSPQNKWCATLHRRSLLGSRPVFKQVHRLLAPGKDWGFSAVVRPGGSTRLPWLGQWDVVTPTGGKWAFLLDRFFGVMSLGETPILTPEETEAFARLESSWQSIANQLAATPPALPGPPLPSGKKTFFRVRELLVDTDGDGLLDVDELSGPTPTNPLNPDSDGDGQYDGDLPAAADPGTADEDGDGVPDVEDAVPYDKSILWPRLTHQYAWAPLDDG